jgi:hypothetical protein
MQRFSKHWGVVIFFVCKRDTRFVIIKGGNNEQF